MARSGGTVMNTVMNRVLEARPRVGTVTTLVLVLAGVGGWPLAAQTAPPLDLEAVVVQALRANPSLRAEEARRDEVEAGIVEVAADAWPQLTVMSSWSRARSPSLLNSPDFADIVDQFPDFTPRRQELFDLRLELTQPLYTGGSLSAARRLAERVRDAAGAQIDGARLDTARDAAQRFYELLAAQAAVATVASQQRARAASLEVVQARYEIGEATELDRLRARAALDAVAPELARRTGDVTIAESRLREVLGLDADATLAVTDLASFAPVTEDLPPTATLEANALATRPELADLRHQQAALDAQRSVRVADGKPQVELNGTYGRQARLVEDLTDRLFDDWSLAVSLSWSVFDGGRRKGQVAQLESQSNQTDWRRRALRDAIAAEVAVARAAYDTARATHRAARTASQVADEAERVARESYRLGVALEIDLLDAQEQATARRLGVVDATLDTLVAAVAVRRAVGLLPTAPLPMSVPSDVVSEGDAP